MRLILSLYPPHRVAHRLQSRHVIEIPAGVRPITQPELSKLDPEAQGKIKFACTSLIQIQSGTQELPELRKLAAQYGQAGMLLHAYEIIDQSTICYQNADLLDPNESFWWHYLLAHTLREANQMSEAIEHHFNEAEKTYTKLGNQQPALLQAIYYYLGDTHLSPATRSGRVCIPKSSGGR